MDHAEGSGVICAVLGVITGMAALLSAAVPVSAGIIPVFTPTFEATHAGATLYNGNPNDPYTPPDPIVINGAALTEATSSWTIRQLEPWQDDAPPGRSVAVLMRFDPDTWTIEGGIPQLGENIAITHLDAFSSTTAKTYNVNFDLSLLGDASTTSGVYHMLLIEEPETKDIYSLDPYYLIGSEPFTDQDLADVLAGTLPDNIGVNDFPQSRLLEFSYVAGEAPKKGCQGVCESNVLFIPGLEGSRLYMRDVLGENQLWEPGILSLQSDAVKLYLNPDGTSINSVYTKDGTVVDEASAEFGGVVLYKMDVYKTFLKKLTELKANGNIADYLAFPYDWRMSPADVVNDGTAYNDGTHFIDQELISLASTSKSGKVTIVGHSNGGLVAKALMEKLQAEGKANLVDKIILVDVPQLGTPKTIASLLHGDFQGIGWNGINFIVSPAKARGFGKNMPDGYDLLPSAAYFARVATPVINMASSTLARSTSGVTSTSVNNTTDLRAFLTGAGGRTTPSYGDTDEPEVLSPSLFDQATTLHQSLDSWVPPSGVQVIQIAGWGEPTPADVTYADKTVRSCISVGCTTVSLWSHVVGFVMDGDGTVVLSSQVANAGWPAYYIDLRAYNAVHQTNLEHGTIMSSEAFKDLFSGLLATTSPAVLPAFVTANEPHATPSDATLRVRTLSPVTLDVYDSQGRHTGMAANPDPSSDLQYVQAQIPNSTYQTYGEGKYIYVPADGNYKVSMHGTDTGTFTFEVTKYAGNAVLQTASYADIPVTASSTATAEINTTNPAATKLVVDMNGDGKTDITLASSTQASDPAEYTKLIISSIKAMDMGKSLRQQLIAKFTNVEFMLSLSTKWDTSDDDNDRARMQSWLPKGKLLKAFDKQLKALRTKLVLQKLGTIERYVEQQLKQAQRQQKPQKWVYGFLKIQNLGQISPDQATSILNSIDKLKTLIVN